jgi:K+ transporter
VIDWLAGTSPLYTFAGIFADESLERTPENVIGAQ